MISLDIQEKKNWEDTVSSYFVNKFYSIEKNELLKIEENEFEKFFETNEFLFQELFQELKKLYLDDISALIKIKDHFSLIKTSFTDLVAKIKQESENFTISDENLDNNIFYKKFLENRLILSLENTTIFSSSQIYSK